MKKPRASAPKHKQTGPLNIITVREANNTYTAAWDGEKTSCTAGPDMAAKRLAAKILGRDVALNQLPEERKHYYRYQVSI